MARKNSTYESDKKRITKGDWQHVRALLGFVGPFKWYFLVGLIFLLLTSAISLAFPVLLGSLIGSSESTDMTQSMAYKLIGPLLGSYKQLSIRDIAITLFIIFAANAVFSYMRVYLFHKGTQLTLAHLRQTIYTNLVRLPMTFFAKSRVGELNSRLAADVGQLEGVMSTTMAEFVRQVIIIPGGITLLFFISPRMTFLMLGTIPAAMIGAVVFGRFIRKLSKKTQDKVAESTTIMEETLQGIANVKAFANEFLEIARYRKSTSEIAKIAVTASKWRGVFVAYIIFCLFGAIIGVVWYGVELRNQGEITHEQFNSFLLLTVFVGASIGGVADLYSQTVKAIGATEKLLDLLHESPEPVLTEAPGSRQELKLVGNVSFDKVNFHYPSRDDVEVLRELSFSVKAGEQVAVVGPSGAGKSTLISMLLRFYLPTSGVVSIDGKDITTYALSPLRDQMALVPQDVLLFGGTILENIEYGKPGASEAEVRAAAEKANALEFIDSFPDKLQTIVGERGVQLSGGQRQRIAIARAVLKDPAILILDEATSSLDSESERLVQEALDKLMEGRTSFVIAHRLSTIRNADKILVLENGRLREEGSHASLMKLEGGLYKNLSELQFETST